MLRLKLIILTISLHTLLFWANADARSGFFFQATDNENYRQHLEALIDSGFKAETIGPNSLLNVSRQLKVLNTENRADKAPLLYAELFEAYYAWLSADHIKGLELAFKCLDDAQKWKVNRAIPAIFALIGNLHKETDNYKMAFIAADEGLKAARQLNDTASIIKLLGLKAMFIKTYSLLNSKPQAKDGSTELQFQGLSLAESNPKYESIRIKFYDNIAQHFKDVKNYDQAIYYANKGIVLATKNNEQRSLTYGYCWLGEAYYYKGNRVYGIACVTKALNIAAKLKQPYRMMELYETISSCYESSGDYKPAFISLSISKQMRDSLKVIENEKQMGEFQIKYDSAKKDKELALMNQASLLKGKLIVWLIGGAIFFVLISLTLLYMYQLIRQNNLDLKSRSLQISEQSQKLQVLMQELHHRVKNNLQIVSSLLNLQSNRLTDIDARNALKVSRQRIEAMSILHHSLYQRDSANMVNMKEYGSHLLNSIIQSFGVKTDEMDIRIDIAIKDIDVDIALPLGLILNEWITNVFKHAYFGTLRRPSLDLTIFYVEDDLKLKIQDNGIGMPVSLWDNPKSSFGIKLIKVLIKQLRGVSSISNHHGTIFELDIPC